MEEEAATLFLSRLSWPLWSLFFLVSSSRAWYFWPMVFSLFSIHLKSWSLTDSCNELTRLVNFTMQEVMWMKQSNMVISTTVAEVWLMSCRWSCIRKPWDRLAEDLTNRPLGMAWKSNMLPHSFDGWLSQNDTTCDATWLLVTQLLSPSRSHWGSQGQKVVLALKCLYFYE